MIAFYLLLLLDSLLLQPIRCVLGFAMRFLWHPPRVVSAPSYTFGDLAGIAKERLATLSREIYGQGGDSAKFLGMLF